MNSLYLTFIVLASVLVIVTKVESHGYMAEPPNRSSMWRYGFNTSINYNDNEHFCGGFTTQWQTYKGNCGECGDSYGLPRPRPNENGGKYGTGRVVRRYRAGQTIPVSVKITANHKGWFQFSVCPLSNVTSQETDQCFSKNVLQLANGSGTQYKLPSTNTGLFTVLLKLPPTLICDRCVLQWHYNTGNSWGVCPDGTGAVGCGPQENFRSCSDISIMP